MTAQQYLDAIEKASSQTRGIVVRSQDRPWGVEWDYGELDPFTESLPVTYYYTAAEGIRAASGDTYTPDEYPQVREAVEA